MIDRIRHTCKHMQARSRTRNAQHTTYACILPHCIRMHTTSLYTHAYYILHTYLTLRRPHAPTREKKRAGGEGGGERERQRDHRGGVRGGHKIPAKILERWVLLCRHRAGCGNGGVARVRRFSRRSVAQQRLLRPLAALPCARLPVFVSSLLLCLSLASLWRVGKGGRGRLLRARRIASSSPSRFPASPCLAPRHVARPLVHLRVHPHACA